MADKHGGACEGKPSIDWDALKDQLSVETLESLQQHLAEVILYLNDNTREIDVDA